MKSAKDIVIISSIDWSFNWQGPQEIAIRLAKQGNSVLFIENTGVRTPNLQDFGRIKRRLYNWRNRNKGDNVAEVAENLYVFSPIVLPPFGSPFRRYINKNFFLPSIKKAVENLGMKDPTIMTFLPTDTASDMIQMIKGEKSQVMLYVAGDFDNLITNRDKLRQSEKEIAAISESVLTICDELSDRYKLLNPNVYTFPYGVNLDAFKNGNKAKVLKFAKQITPDYEKNRKPIVGYVGALHRHVNVEMLEKCARLRKDLSWVFVGPIHTDVSSLEKLPNVTFLGQKPHEELVYFIENFDVCMIPYMNSPFTQTVVPVKLNEYLAVGKPVVSTDIPIMKEFNNKYDVVKICENDAAEFVLSIDEYLDEKESLSIVKKRKSIAKLSNWENRFESICKLMDSTSQKESFQITP